MHPITVYPAIDGAFAPASFLTLDDAIRYGFENGLSGVCWCYASNFNYQTRLARIDWLNPTQLAMEFVLP